MIKNRRAFIVGIKSTYLLKKEKSFLKKYKPWGIILFSRNLKNINQIKVLTSSIKKIFNDKNYPILIDEEGGRVSRLNKIINTSIFSGSFFGELYKKNKKKFFLYYKIYIQQMSYLLNEIGVNINTVPVLDLRRNKSHDIIGNRAFSNNSKITSLVGDYCIDQYGKSRIATVIKHIPGHGLATVDSHKKLPIVTKSKKYLLKNDFYTFKNKKSLFAMTAHVLYKNFDSTNCATHSKKIISIIRNKISFKNLIMSDDVSMKSLKHSISNNTKKAFTAGCNLVLHCNGNLKEMAYVAENSPFLDKQVLKKTSEFKTIIS